MQAYLETHPAELASCRTLLELGSGTGWLGMMVALNMPGVERIYLSEMLDGEIWGDIGRYRETYGDVGSSGAPVAST